MAADNQTRLRLLAGRTAGPLTASLGAGLGLPAETLRVERFANENLVCEAAHMGLEGADVVYVQTSLPPVHENLMEALFSLDAIRAARPCRLTALLPYLPYARSDRPETPEGPVQARLIAKLFEQAGADRILAFDLHSPQLVGVYRIPVRELSALQALVAAIRAWKLADPVIASPDLGGAKRAGAASTALGVPLVLFRKQRRGREVTSELLGEVANRSVVIFDDEIATGSTMISASRIAREQGARAVVAVATHAVFAGDVLEKLAGAGIQRVLVSDTVPVRASGPVEVEVASVVPALIEALS